MCIRDRLPTVWLRGGFASLYLDLDFARDLHEISNIWIGRIVWLGPELRSSFHIPPFYYYMFYPALWIGSGNVRAMIIFNIFLSLTVLFWLGWLGVKKRNLIWLLAVAVIGLTPYWQKISLHPGNGNTYVIFLLGTLVSLWFKKPIWLSSLFAGAAIALHPTSIFICPILIYEWLRKKRNYLKNFIITIASLIIFWVPNLLFLVITKGYWIRQWLSEPNWDVFLSFDVVHNIKNILLLARLSGIHIILFFSIWLFIGFKTQLKRLKIWYFIVSFFIILLAFFNPMPERYLYGITTMTLFVAVLSLVKRNKKVILFIYLTLLIINLFQNPPKIAERSIVTLENNINTLIRERQINKKQKLALLTVHEAYGGITPGGGLIPQSNDYRFFLRTKGYKALDVSKYAQADILVIFLEDSDFDWQNWICWELNEFGEKELKFATKVGETKMLVFDKK